MAVPVVAGTPDGQFLPLDIEARFRSRGLHRLHGLRHDFEPDIIAEQNSDFEHTGSLRECVDATR
jgi:hypothetical protein